jgi:imidazolonepropionase-like amidohydrolase
LQSGSVQLNGRVLRLQTNGNLPPLTPKLEPTGQLDLAPASITFLAVPKANNPRCATGGAGAQQAAGATKGPPSSILLKNVQVFDGVDARLKSGSVLVEDKKIKQVSHGPITPSPESLIIDGRGRVLMPGLTDAHWHMTMAAKTLADLDAADTGLMYANTMAEARRTLMRGFTTVRDVAGPTFGIKVAIDARVIPGPRVYPSSALISQTAGHGDFDAA